MALRAVADVCVIGGGVMGTSAALMLARGGRSVCVIEPNRGVGLGSTSFSSGILRTYYSVLESTQFAWEGYHYWQHWAEHIGVCDDRGFAKYRETGSIILEQKVAKPFLDTITAHSDTIGISYERLDREETERRFGPESPIRMSLQALGPPRRLDHPEFGVLTSDDEPTGSVFFPQSGYVSDPNLAVNNLRMACEATGRCSFLFGKTVTELILQSGKTAGVKLSDGSSVAASAVLNAAGPHSSTVNAMAFAADGAPPNDQIINTKPLRVEVAYVNAPPGVNFERDGIIMTDFDTGVYIRPEVGNKILIGSIEPECDHLEYLNNPDEASSGFSEMHTTQIMRLALRFPEVQLPSAANTQGIISCYDTTPDWTPIYDKSAIPGYFMAIGTSGNQFKNCANAGALIAQLIDRDENGIDQDSDPLQFELSMSGSGSVNTKRFSRLRNETGVDSVLG